MYTDCPHHLARCSRHFWRQKFPPKTSYQRTRTNMYYIFAAVSWNLSTYAWNLFKPIFVPLKVKMENPHRITQYWSEVAAQFCMAFNHSAPLATTHSVLSKQGFPSAVTGTTPAVTLASAHRAVQISAGFKFEYCPVLPCAPTPAQQLSKLGARMNICQLSPFPVKRTMCYVLGSSVLKGNKSRGWFKDVPGGR